MPDSDIQTPTRRVRRVRQLREAIITPSFDARIELPTRGDTIAEKYRIERLLDRGGMGAVYEASHLWSGKRVAVKWMLPSLEHEGLAERFMHEARATARIDHPNVVDIYDVGRHDDSVYLVMELLHGESLATRLRRATIGAAEAVPLLMPALRGVAAAHARGVIHRDLKPDNIFMCTGPDGEARDCKVLDFGISKVATDDCDLSITKTGAVMGTPYYMSPEQIRGLKEVDERGDIYAFGVILYEILADSFPFDADTYGALVVKVATHDPIPLSGVRPDLDPALTEVVMRAMARDRELRYRNVSELAQALLPFAAGVPFRSPPVFSGSFPAHAADDEADPLATVPVEAPAGGFGAKSGRWPRALVIAGLLLLAGAAAAWWSGAGPVLEMMISAPMLPSTGQRATENLAAAPAPEPATLASGLQEAPQSGAAPARRGPRAVRVNKPSATSAGTRTNTDARDNHASRAGRDTSLPRDWDARIPAVSTTGPRARAVSSTRGGHHAGQLSAADL
jgi:serine/threonine-protein kinase